MKAIEIFTIGNNRAKNLLLLHKEKAPQGRPQREGIGADLLRSAYVMSLSSLDTYLHVKTAQSVRKYIFHNKRVPVPVADQIAKYLGDKMPVTKLLEIALSTKPSEKIISILENCLSVKTLQKPGQIKSVFEMMQIGDPWQKIDKNLSIKKRKIRGKRPSAKTFLQQVSDRRDDIVHSGDIYTKKKFHGKMRIITRRETQECLSRIEQIVYAIEKIVI
jgi:hypothetical protein